MSRGTYSVQCDKCKRTTKEWQTIGGKPWCKPCVKAGTDYLSQDLGRRIFSGSQAYYDYTERF